jgi:UDPglucose 6-dehydrogenase
MQLAQRYQAPLELIPAIKRSNDRHRHWTLNRLESLLGDLSGKKIALIGLTYKPGTDTLRRSLAIELLQKLEEAGCHLSAFDPMVKKLPDRFAAVQLASSLSEALVGVDALAVCTEWPPFRKENWAGIIASMQQRIIVDANGFLEKELQHLPQVRYYSVGKS